MCICIQDTLAEINRHPSAGSGSLIALQTPAIQVAKHLVLEGKAGLRPHIASGDVLLHLTMRFIATGMRKEHDKKDIYRVAEKLVRMVLDDDDTLDSVSDVSETD